MSDLFDLSGEVAMVIGATGVLGGAIAEGLAAHGAQVAVLGRNEERGQARVDAITAAGGTACFLHCDASDKESLEAALAATCEQYERCSILVSAAGGNDPKVTVTEEHPVEAIEADAWRDNFDLNLVGGALLPAQVVGPHMIEQGGWQHHQHRLGLGPSAAEPGGQLLGGEGRRAQPVAVPRP